MTGRNWQRQAIAAPDECESVHEARIVASIPDHVAWHLGLPESARAVAVGTLNGLHLSRSRRADEEVAFCMRHLPLVVTDPSHYCVRCDEPRRFALARETGGAYGSLYVALKWVPAAMARSHADEVWVQTAYPLGQASWRRYLRTGRLTALAGRADPGAG